MARTQFQNPGRGRGGTGRNSGYVNSQNTTAVGQFGINGGSCPTVEFVTVEENSNSQLDLNKLGYELSVGDSTIRGGGPAPLPIDSTRNAGIDVGTTTILPFSGACLKKFGIIAGSTTTSKVKRDITRMFKNHFKYPILSWKGLKEDMRNLYWRMFKTMYEVPLDKEELYRDIFENVAGERYKSMLYEARKDAMIAVGTNSIADCSDNPPNWMHDSIWKLLVEQWSDEEWQNKSNKSRCNRLTEKDGSIAKHTAGSVSFAEHKIVMTEELGKEPTHAQLFNRVHKRKRGAQDFIDNKSKRVATEYETSVVNKTGSVEAASEVEFDEESWFQVTGGPKKGRLYGVGNVDSSSGSSVGTRLFTQEEVEQVVATRMTDTEARLRANLESSLWAEMEMQWEVKFEAAFAHLASQNRTSTADQQ